MLIQQISLVKNIVCSKIRIYLICLLHAHASNLFAHNCTVVKLRVHTVSYQSSVFLLFRSKPNEKKKRRKRKRRVKKIDEAKLIDTNNCFDEVDVTCDKLETLCDTIQNGLTEDNKIETQFSSVPIEKRDSYYRLLCLFESDLGEDCETPFSDTDIYAEYVSLMYLNGTSIRDEIYELPAIESQ